MNWTLITVVILLMLLYKVAITRSPKLIIFYLASASLYNIPVFILGNSSSSGIFIFDIVLLFYILKRTITQPLSLKKILESRGNTILMMLLVFIAIRTLFVFLQDYGYYNNFILYGFYRWCTFGAFLILISIKHWNFKESVSILRKFMRVLLIFLLFAIIHQLGILDLSGYEAMGMDEEFFTNEEFADFFFRTFLGNVSASVGFLSVVGVLLSLIFLKLKIDTIQAIAGLFMSSFVLIGSWSRTDVIALVLSIVIFLLIARRGLVGSYATRLSVFVFSIALLAFSVLLYNEKLNLITTNRTFERFFETEYSRQFIGVSEGTLSYRIIEQKKALTYIFENLDVLLFGLGPNGYRMIVVEGISTMGFGHNVYLHTLGELGIIGFFMVTIFLLSLFSNIYKNMKHAPIQLKVLFLFTFLVLSQRLIAGSTVDTIFAVDNVIPMSIIFLFTTVIISRTQYNT